MLSEKAKGKRRATELVEADHDEPDAAQLEPTYRDLVIRFTEGMPDLSIKVFLRDTVRDVKRNIRELRPGLHNRRLRLIYSGRLLTDGTVLYDWLETLEKKQKRATKESDGQDVTVSVDSSTTWLHCSIGPVLEDEEESEDKKAQTAQLQPLRGFDRLTASGFSPEDIANFRQQFHSHSSSNYLDSEFETEEEYNEHIRALEEQWIDSLDSVGSATLSQAANPQIGMTWGVLLGFFFPVIPFFFFKEVPKPAIFWDDGAGDPDEPTFSVVLSRQMQMGVAIGFLVNILFGVWRYILDVN